MTKPLRSVGAITLFVEDIDRARIWYETVFELAPMFVDDDSAAFAWDNTIINLLRLSAAHSLITPAPAALAHEQAHAQFTIWVDDADATCAELIERGVTLVNGPLDRAWGQRTACFADPDGHIWEVAQSLT